VRGGRLSRVLSKVGRVSISSTRVLILVTLKVVLSRNRDYRSISLFNRDLIIGIYSPIVLNSAYLI
jgi:hypothetical protein